MSGNGDNLTLGEMMFCRVGAITEKFCHLGPARCDSFIDRIFSICNCTVQLPFERTKAPLSVTWITENLHIQSVAYFNDMWERPWQSDNVALQ